MKHDQLEELVLQSLEQGRSGARLYEAALECALNAELQAEWQRYLEETKSHVSALEGVCKALGISAKEQTPGRLVVQHLGSALVQAVRMAHVGGNLQAAQLVAAECILLAETRAHLDWQLLGQCCEQLPPDQARVLGEAYQRIEGQEDEHLYHTKRWCRDLWSEALGLSVASPAATQGRQRVEPSVAQRSEQAAE
ncbi:MAG: hypothetical protein RL685_271 [Pseudomonadota bacterium]|jgi:hypothetical protein